jgi:hypothetical protein
VTATLHRILVPPHVRFLGTVEYGRDLTPDDLTRRYEAIIYAVGAAADRPLGIPGEHLSGSLSATEFVAWYNPGHPDPTAVLALLEARQVAYVTLDEWLRLDRHEQERGRAQGRSRVKVVPREVMLRLARGGLVAIESR